MLACRQFKLIEPVLFLYVLGLFFTFPVEQQLVYRKVCLTRYNNTFCKSNTNIQKNKDAENIIQEESAKWGIYISLSRTIPSIFSTVLYGAWSDMVGRKKILIIAMLGEIIGVITYLINALYIRTPLQYLYIGNILSGMCGNFATILLSVFSYIADVTTVEWRTTRIAILDALLHIASIISCLAGGLMLQRYGFASVYILVLIIYGMIIVYAVLFLKESYVPTEDIKIRNRGLRSQLTVCLKLFTSKRSKYYHVKMMLYIGCFFTLFFQIIAVGDVIILYLLHKPLNFQPLEIGYFCALGHAVKFVGILLTAWILINKFKWRDSSLILLSTILSIFNSFFLGLSKIDWQVYLTTVLGIGVGVGNGACRSGLSKLVSAEEQGKMSSIIANIQVISLSIAAVVCNSIYKATVHISPSITFYCVSGFTLIAVLLSILLKFFENKDELNVDVQLDDIDEVALLSYGDGAQEFSGDEVALLSCDLTAQEFAEDEIELPSYNVLQQEVI